MQKGGIEGKSRGELSEGKIINLILKGAVIAQKKGETKYIQEIDCGTFKAISKPYKSFQENNLTIDFNKENQKMKIHYNGDEVLYVNKDGVITREDMYNVIAFKQDYKPEHIELLDLNLICCKPGPWVELLEELK